MRSTLLADLLGPLGVAQTHNRPWVSNDKPFSESEFRTMKYRPSYLEPSPLSTTPAPTWTGTCPGTTPTTSTPASPCSHPTKFTTAPGATDGPTEHAFTTPTPNAFAETRRRQHLPASWGSTSPRNTRTPPNGSDSSTAPDHAQQEGGHTGHQRHEFCPVGDDRDLVHVRSLGGSDKQPFFDGLEPTELRRPISPHEGSRMPSW
jgi:hypothetical protein